jgi:hypothetical protein
MDWRRRPNPNLKLMFLAVIIFLTSSRPYAWKKSTSVYAVAREGKRASVQSVCNQNVRWWSVVDVIECFVKTLTIGIVVENPHQDLIGIVANVFFSTALDNISFVLTSVAVSQATFKLAEDKN